MKEAGIKVSIIIVNWNGIRHLPTCLTSLAAQTFEDFEVVLVDNGSSDGSADFVRREYPFVKLVTLHENRGFAGGNNTGLAHCSGDYIVTLNNDTWADPGWLEELVATADAVPGAGMVGSRICAFDDPDRIDSLGVGICPDGMSRGTSRNRRFSSLHPARMEEILLPSACAALYKKAMINDVGFFDEDFFAYCEDTDLGLRGRLAGWQAVLASNAVVRHKYSGTGGHFSPLKVYLVERNHFWVALKNFPFLILALVPAFTMIRFIVQAQTVLSAKGSGREFRASAVRPSLLGAVFKGMWDAFSPFPHLLEKRRKVMIGRRISSGEMIRLLRKYRLHYRDLLDASG